MWNCHSPIISLPIDNKPMGWWRLGLVVEEIDDWMVIVVGFRLGGYYRPPPGIVVELRIGFHRMQVHSVVIGHFVIIFSAIGRLWSYTSGASRPERTEMSGELLVHERGEIFHASRDLEVIVGIFRSFSVIGTILILRSLTDFRSFPVVGSVNFGSLAIIVGSLRRLSFGMSDFRPVTGFGSHTHFVFLNGRSFFGRSWWRSLTVGTDDVAIFGRECRRNYVSCHFSVQRRVQVSIALDVAAASNGNLKPQTTHGRWWKMMQDTIEIISLCV